jgi:uncharacterized membrane protein YphA (DoxX/SURF4 family)
VQAVGYLMEWHDMQPITFTVALLLIASGLALLIGYLTPLAAVLAGITIVASALSWFPTPDLYVFEPSLSSVLATIIAAAIVCLGPGAFSLDARLFGRREIMIPSAHLHGSDTVNRL